jgi:hypothetical protein
VLVLAASRVNVVSVVARCRKENQAGACTSRLLKFKLKIHSAKRDFRKVRLNSERSLVSCVLLELASSFVTSDVRPESYTASVTNINAILAIQIGKQQVSRFNK